MKPILYITIPLAILALFIVWSEKRTDALNTAYAAYEGCVLDQYGTTPAAWYATHGTTPDC